MYLRRVKELREDSDTPQKVIAEYLGVKQNTYSDYENDVSMDYLMGRTDER